MPGKSIYLTFDDGPADPYTSRILDHLANYNAKATFFVCGKNILRNPITLKKTYAAGHAIGNHAYSHTWLKSVSPSLFKEFKQTEKIIAGVTGEITKLVRAPWGRMIPPVRKHLEDQGYKIFHWDIHTYDWWQPNASYIAAKVVREAFDGSIVLLHDGQKTEEHKSREQTVLALPIILNELQKQGYEFHRL